MRNAAKHVGQDACMPMEVKVWLQALRPMAQLNLAIPIVFGEAFAFYAIGQVHPVGLLWAHLFALSAQPAIIFANDLADEHADSLQDQSTLLAGGSRVLVEGKLSRRVLTRALWLAWLVHLLVGAAASAWLGHWAPLVCAALTLGLTQIYSFKPMRLSYRGLGGLVQAIGTGVVLPIVGSILASRSLLVPPWMILMATGLLGLASNWITSIPDAQRDRLARKWSMAGRLGAQRTALLAWGLIFVVTLSGFRSHGSLQGDAMRFVSLACWLGLLLAGLAIWRRASQHVLITWLLLGCIQILWLGWCVVLINQAR